MDIIKFCYEFENELFKDESKEDILMSCVSQKLSSLYMSQSKRFDEILEELSSCIDTDDMEHTYRVIKRLSKSLANNRAQLLSLLEEVNKYGKV